MSRPSAAWIETKINELKINPGARHLFRERGSWRSCGAYAAAWFGRYLAGRAAGE